MEYVNTKEGIRIITFVNILATLVLVCFKMTPLLERTSSRYVTLPLWGIWVVSTFLMPKERRWIVPTNFIKWWILYILWIFFMFFVGHSNLPILDYVNRLTLYSIPFMLIAIVDHYNPTEKKLLWILILVIFTYSLVDNITMGTQNPEIYGRLHKMDVFGFWATNAGGTSHIVQCLFMCPIFWFFYQNVNKKFLKIISLTFLVVTTYYIMFVNNRTTSLIIWLFMAGMYVMFYRGKIQNNSIKSLIKKSIPLILFVVLFAGPILEILLIVFSGSERMSVRLEELLSFSEDTSISSVDEESLYARYILWKTSVTTFLSSIPNMLIGIGEDVHDEDIISLVRHGVGYHSEFFDLAAKYGIIGITLVYFSLKNLFAYIRSLCNSEKEVTMLNIMFLAFMIYSFFNNTFRDSTFYVVFIFLPLTIMVINYTKSEHE